jgi:hypothetical protein
MGISPLPPCQILAGDKSPSPTVRNPDINFVMYPLSSRLDGKHVVFGNVTDGMDVVRKIEGFGSSGGATNIKIVVTNCGEL